MVRIFENGDIHSETRREGKNKQKFAFRYQSDCLESKAPLPVYPDWERFFRFWHNLPGIVHTRNRSDMGQNLQRAR